MKTDNNSSPRQRMRVDKFRLGPCIVVLLILTLSLLMTSCAMLAANAAY